MTVGRRLVDRRNWDAVRSGTIDQLAAEFGITFDPAV